MFNFDIVVKMITYIAKWGGSWF